MIRVLQPGLLTSVQDLGRIGYQKYGVIVGGVMDAFAHRVANLLVGNPETSPTLELTLLGPTLEFTEDTLIAVTGGGMWPSVEGDVVPLWRPVLVLAGTVLRFTPNQHGCRAYLAVAGGFLVPRIMDSASTYLRAGIGGFEGRALKQGDMLSAGERSEISKRRIHHLRRQLEATARTLESDRILHPTQTPTRAETRAETEAVPGPGAEPSGMSGSLPNQVVIPNWFANFSISPYHRRSVLHALPGAQFDRFSEESRAAFFGESFTVSSQSDRMGYRVSGPRLALEDPTELISEAVTNGTVQVPADGNPIILLADHQTTGGYPKIAQIATADIPLLAQIRPGEKIRFEPISLAGAQAMLRKQEQDLAQLRLALRWT